MTKWYGVFGWLNCALYFFLLLPLIAVLLFFDQIRFAQRWGWVIEFGTVMGCWFERVFFKMWAGVNLGSIIIYRGDYVESSFTQLHERKHAEQVFTIGIFYPIVYFAASVILWIFYPSKHAYLDNPFERAARKAAGQPVDIAPQDWFQGPNDRWPWW